MADFSQLGEALGGGDPDLAFAKGRHLGATTEVALSQAAERVEKQKAQQGLAAQLEAAGFDPKVAAASATALTAGGGLGDVLSMLGKQQEQGFRKTAADPNTSFDIGNRALLGVASGPVDPVQKVGNGYIDRFNTEAGIQALPASAQDSTSKSGQIQLLEKFGFGDSVIPEAQRAQALATLRDLFKVTDFGGVPGLVNTNPYGGPAAPQGAGLGDSLSPPPMSAPPSAGPPAGPGGVTSLAPVAQVASNAAAIANAKKTGEMQAQGAAALPGKIASLDRLDANIDRFLAMPGFDSSYGKMAGPASGITQFASQDISNANAQREQLKGQTFLASIQDMRGFGQLSNAEGLKVQAAYTLATTTNIDPATARMAWQEVKAGTARLRTVAAQEAGGAPAASGGAYADPGKEARYQAWKAQQGAR